MLPFSVLFSPFIQVVPELRRYEPEKMKPSGGHKMGPDETAKVNMFENCANLKNNDLRITRRQPVPPSLIFIYDCD
jgi:hypothetical protein